jgi:hypothetical protein
MNPEFAIMFYPLLSEHMTTPGRLNAMPSNWILGSVTELCRLLPIFVKAGQQETEEEEEEELYTFLWAAEINPLSSYTEKHFEFQRKMRCFCFIFISFVVSLWR